MKSKVTIAVRVILGLAFFASGLVGLLNLVPMPPDLPERLQTFNKGIEASGYFMTLVKGTELVCGLLLISGFFVPLALVVLAPVVLNIFLVHAFMAPEGLPVPIIMGIAMIYLSFFAEPYRNVVLQLFRR